MINIIYNSINKPYLMNITIWDTYVSRKDGKEMHFNIFTPKNLQNLEKIIDFGLEYLKSKPFETSGLISNQCNQCSFENINVITDAITQRGYSIKEIKNCS